MKYKDEINSEWFRLIRNEGFSLEPLLTLDGDCLVKYEGEVTGRILDDGEVLIKPGCGELMSIVCELHGLTCEYVSAYQRNSTDTSLPNGYRRISELGGHVLAAKMMPDTSFEFVTWLYSDENHEAVTQGNYFTSYEDAKTDFGVRSGLIDRSKLFSQNELEFLYKHMSRYLDLNNYISFDDEKDMLSMLEKMKEIHPECRSEYMTDMAEDDFDNEPE